MLLCAELTWGHVAVLGTAMPKLSTHASPWKRMQRRMVRDSASYAVYFVLTLCGYVCVITQGCPWTKLRKLEVLGLGTMTTSLRLCNNISRG